MDAVSHVKVYITTCGEVPHVEHEGKGDCVPEKCLMHECLALDPHWARHVYPSPT